MPPFSTNKAHKRRRMEDEVRPKKKVHVKKQKHYHKDSDEDEMEDELAKNTALNMAQESDEESADEGADENVEAEDLEDLADNDDEPALSTDEESDVGSETSMSSSRAARNKKKRNDPEAFATSITKILGSKLTSAKRADPVLSRSASAAEANRTLADEKLEQKARAQIRAEKRAALEKGRVKDVLGLQTEGANTGEILEEEKTLKKTAQRGVVKLFNAVRAAQVKAEEASRMARAEGVVGMKQREERVNEMSKQGFLDLISSGGKPATAA
ncbi:Rrp15p-domain-containing protein [Teratosphaeria nubilosa]|uniref:Rrp15p-domain-containing protein n=1 Tax=Teratosphaeria nubilosa TaxID=161662 RepID=A0A6G1LA25_9PEZI|nr:Rrp15p-domain-containing protein [Teratosphaeria nubilosa]